MGKTINTILNLTDKFTPKLTAAGKQALTFKQQLKNANSAADAIDAGLAKAAKTAAAFGSAAAAAVGAFAVSSVNTYKDFQQSMSNVAGIKGITQTSEEYKKLEEAARDAGKSTTKTAQESADALSYMALAGWSVDDSISALEPVLRASEATGADLATTSDLITDSMSALGISVNDLEGYLDICSAAQNNSNTSLTQLQEAFITCGATLNSFNVGAQEGAALLGTLANRGLKGSEAGNSLQSVLVNLTKKSGESYDAMQALGVSAYDANGDFKGFSNVLEEVNQATAAMTEEQRNTYLTMIGGKTQLTTLQDLMAGLTTQLEDGSYEFDALYDTLGDCDGALDKMADTMTDNLAGALSLAQSATDDFKIEIGSKLEPYVTQAVRWFSSLLPDATEKFGAWLDNKIPRAIDACKSAFEKIKPAITFVVDNFQELIGAAAGVVVGLKAFSIMTKIASFTNKLSGVMKGLSTAQKLATVAQTAFNTSLLACPLTWIAAGIGAVVAGVLVWKKHMEKAAIAKHFGDITLSAEECQNIVKNVFGEAVVKKTNAAADAYEDFQQSIETVSDSMQNLDKLNFKIELGGDVDKETYMNAADEYIENLQQALTDKQYSLKLNLNLLFNGSEFGTGFTAAASGFYGELSQHAEQLGTQLKEAVENAYEHGWDLDSTEAVAAILKQQSEIQSQIETAQSEARLEGLKHDFTMGDLSQDSFTNLMDATNEELANLKEAYSTARTDAIAAAKLMYGENSALYSEALAQANAAYDEQIAALSQKGLAFENTAIMEAFPQIGTALNEAAKSLDFDGWGAMLDEVNSGAAEFSEGMMNTITSTLEAAFSSGVDPATRKLIGGYFEQMLPQYEDYKTQLQSMEQVPADYANVFTQSAAVGAVGDNAQALYDLGVSTVSTVLPSDESKILASSKKYGDSYIKGIKQCENPMQNACNSLRQILTDTLQKPLTATVQVQVKTSTSGGGTGITSDDLNTSSLGGATTYSEYLANAAAATASSTPSTSGSGDAPNAITVDDLGYQATGTAYFGGGFTHINENGGEIVGLPTGAVVIPADKTDKLLSNRGSSVNVNVYVQGSIFGTEEAADIIGGKVCEKVVNCIAAV